MLRDPNLTELTDSAWQTARARLEQLIVQVDLLKRAYADLDFLRGLSCVNPTTNTEASPK